MAAGFDKLPEYGALSYLQREDVVSVIEWLIENKYILQTKGLYPVLHPTYEGLHYSETITVGKLKKLRDVLQKDTNDPEVLENINSVNSEALSMNSTLKYYNENASTFVSGTQAVDFHDAEDLFLSFLKPGSSILDFGCGSGRDTRYFLEKGYEVTATDGSERLCALASDFCGIPVRKLLFQELEDRDTYDGIWACASILHAGRAEQPDIYRRMIRALKAGGILYTSYKYGRFEGARGERYFTDFDEESFMEFLRDFPELSIEKMWVSADVRPERSSEKWLNIILRKSIIG